MDTANTINTWLVCYYYLLHTLENNIGDCPNTLKAILFTEIPFVNLSNENVFEIIL